MTPPSQNFLCHSCWVIDCTKLKITGFWWPPLVQTVVSNHMKVHQTVLGVKFPETQTDRQTDRHIT